MFSTLFLVDPVHADVPWTAILAAAAGVVLLSFLILLANRYKRCPKCNKQVRLHQVRCRTCHQVLKHK